MHLVAAAGQRVRQLGGDHAAAADRRVADHADVHGCMLQQAGRWTGSRTTIPSAKATPASAPNCASRLSIELPERRRRQRVSARRRRSTGANWLRVAGERLALALVVRPRRRRRTTASRRR